MRALSSHDKDIYVHFTYAQQTPFANRSTINFLSFKSSKLILFFIFTISHSINPKRKEVTKKFVSKIA